MAFTFSNDRPSQIRVVLRSDSSISAKLLKKKKASDDDDDDEGLEICPYESYLESFKIDGAGNESFLELKGEPTRFILKVQLTWDQQKKLEGDHMSVKGGKDITIGTFMFRDKMRAHIVGIENPSSVPPEKQLKFQKGNDGMIRKEFIQKLEQCKELGNIMKALNNATSVEEEEGGDQSKNS